MEGRHLTIGRRYMMRDANGAHVNFNFGSEIGVFTGRYSGEQWPIFKVGKDKESCISPQKSDNFEWIDEI